MTEHARSKSGAVLSGFRRETLFWAIGYQQGTHCTGKKGKMTKRKSLSGKFCQNTGNFVWSSCKFPDSKDIAIFVAKISIFFLKLDRSGKSVCNSHKLCKLAQGKFAVGQGKNKKPREFESTI